MQDFNNTFPHLAAAPGSELEKNIGKTIKYKVPRGRVARSKFARANGSVALTATYKIIGTQKNYKGDLCYRATCNDYEDSFGRCVSIDEIVFI